MNEKHAKKLICLVFLIIAAVLAGCAVKRSAGQDKTASSTVSAQVRSGIKKGAGHGIDYEKAMKIKEVTLQIQSLNLINSLYLSKDQMKKLLPLAREAKRFKQRKDRRIREIVNDRTYNTLIKARDELLDGIELSGKTKAEVIEREKTPLEESKRLKIKMAELCRKAKGILNENQLVMVSHYHPCIIPQRSVTHPERIGQSGGAGVVLKVLEFVRMMPEKSYKMHKPAFLKKIDRDTSLVIIDSKKRAKLVGKISKTMDQVRNMSEEEFAIKKNVLAGEIVDLHQQFRIGPGGRDRLTDGYVSGYLLNEYTPEIYEYKIKHYDKKTGNRNAE